MRFIRRIFKKRTETKSDMEKLVEEYLRKLPRCNKNVVILSPKYDETCYRCEVVMSAEKLALWAGRHADSVWSVNQEIQVARKVLPIWLYRSKSEGEALSYIPKNIYEVVRPYVGDFVSDRSASVYCFKCRSFINEIQMKKTNQERAGNWMFWNDIWMCREGHHLFHTKCELHIYRPR